MSLASQIRTKPVREQRYRDKLEVDGWRWLRRAIQTWLWHERNRAKARARHSNRYRAHAASEKQADKLRYMQNRVRRLATMAAYRERNRANINAANRESYAIKAENNRRTAAKA